MKHAIETGCDGANVCFFDRAALPPDFDLRMKKAPIETVEELMKDARFWWESTGGDGGFLFHFYVEEPIPPEIAAHLKETQEDRLLVPSGTLCACGLEYAALDPRRGSDATIKGGLDAYPHMGGFCEIPAGTYTVKVSQTEWPDDELETRLRDTLGPAQWRSRNILSAAQVIVALLMLLGGATLLSGLFRYKNYARLWPVLAAFLAFFALHRWLSWRLRKFERDPKTAAVQNEFPSIVVEMRRQTA